MKEDKFETNSKVYRQYHKRTVCNLIGKCDICPWHGGENVGFSRRPKSDRYKDRRKGK